MIDPALETLLLPLREQLISVPNTGTLFLRARPSSSLAALRIPSLDCEQTYKPYADALEHAGLRQTLPATQQYSLILVLSPRQRDEARALFARAAKMVSPGGRIVASALNNEGARSHEKDLSTLCGTVHSHSKNKCRVFWIDPLDKPPDTKLLDEWSALDKPQLIAGTPYLGRCGIFSGDRIDPGSQFLAQHFPSDLAGRAADLGAGYGFLSAELLKRCSKIQTLDLFEAELRALELARRNVSATHARLDFQWHDVTRGLPRTYDVIVMNPPVHAYGAESRVDVGQRFISVAMQALNVDGQLWLVANRKLPYENLMRTQLADVRLVAEANGYKILCAHKATAR